MRKREHTRECLRVFVGWEGVTALRNKRETYTDRRLRRINTGERARHKREQDTGESETQRCRASGLQDSRYVAGGTNCGWEVAYIWNDKPDLIYRFWRPTCVLCSSHHASILTTYMCPYLIYPFWRPTCVLISSINFDDLNVYWAYVNVFWANVNVYWSNVSCAHSDDLHVYHVSILTM